MRRLLLLIRCVMLAALVLLAACTGTSGTTDRSAPSPPVEAQPVSAVTLTIWHSWSGAPLAALNSVARTYEQDHPNVRISLVAQPATDLVRNYSATVADGSAPQLLVLRSRYLSELADLQFIAPLNDALSADALQPLLPAAVAGARVGDRLYGVPITFNTLALFYDRRRVAEPPTTLSALIDLNTAERAQPPTERVLSVGYYLALETTLPYLSAFGGTLLGEDDNPAFASTGRDATTRWLDWLRGFQANENVLATPDFGALDAAIGQGRVLSVIDWAHRRADYAQVWGSAAVGVVPLPLIEGQPQPQALVLPEVLCLNTVTSEEQRAAAEDFLRYMIGQPAQELLWSRGQMLPVHQQAAIDDAVAPFRTIAQNGQALPARATTPDIWRPLSDMLQQVVRNTASAPEAIDAAHAALESQTP